MSDLHRQADVVSHNDLAEIINRTAGSLVDLTHHRLDQPKRHLQRGRPGLEKLFQISVYSSRQRIVILRTTDATDLTEILRLTSPVRLAGQEQASLRAARQELFLEADVKE